MYVDMSSQCELPPVLFTHARSADDSSTAVMDRLLLLLGIFLIGFNRLATAATCKDAPYSTYGYW